MLALGSTILKVDEGEGGYKKIHFIWGEGGLMKSNSMKGNV